MQSLFHGPRAVQAQKHLAGSKRTPSDFNQGYRMPSLCFRFVVSLGNIIGNLGNPAALKVEVGPLPFRDPAFHFFGQVPTSRKEVACGQAVRYVSSLDAAPPQRHYLCSHHQGKLIL